MDVIHGSSSRSSRRWSEEVENPGAQTPPLVNPPASILDNFDVNKMSNAGFKLDYVEPIDHFGERIGEIELEDIQSEIES